MRTKLLATVAVLTLAVVATACGDDGGSEVGSGTEEDPRTIEVSTLDELTFDPTSVEVGVGETIRFVVTNDGEIDHEFVVGDEEMQAMAEEQMAEGTMEHMNAMAAISVAPGETAEAVVTFSEAGELLYGCHVTGHYDGGMVGTIAVG